MTELTVIIHTAGHQLLWLPDRIHQLEMWYGSFSLSIDIIDSRTGYYLNHLHVSISLRGKTLDETMDLVEAAKDAAAKKFEKPEPRHKRNTHRQQGISLHRKPGRR
jgi:hypothetical protein